MAILIDEDVLGFDIAVENMVLVEVADSGAYLHEVDASLLLSHALHLSKLIEELPAWAILHTKADPTLGLEGTLNFAHKSTFWGADLDHHITFIFHD